MFDGHYHGINTGRGYHQGSSIRGPGYHRGQSIRGYGYHRGIVTRGKAYHYRGTNLHNDRSLSPNNNRHNTFTSVQQSGHCNTNTNHKYKSHKFIIF